MVDAIKHPPTKTRQKPTKISRFVEVCILPSRPRLRIAATNTAYNDNPNEREDDHGAHAHAPFVLAAGAIWAHYVTPAAGLPHPSGPQD